MGFRYFLGWIGARPIFFPSNAGGTSSSKLLNLEKAGDMQLATRTHKKIIKEFIKKITLVQIAIAEDHMKKLSLC